MKRAISLAAAVGSLLLPTSAFAHHPEVTASVDCAGLVSYTATAWAGTGGNDHVASRTNPNITITVNGSPAAGGAFASPLFSFSGTYNIAAGAPATVIATAVANWGNGVAGGQSATDNAPAATGCVPPVVPPATPPTTTTVIPPTTPVDQPTTPTTPTTSEGDVEEVPVGSPPVLVDSFVVPHAEARPTGELPFTGVGLGWIAALGAALVAAGLALWRVSRRA